MRGIDISNWQGGLDLNKIKNDIDFVICKATEGNYFVDRFCDGWINQAIRLNMPFGFYHFANDNDPLIEAEFFIKHTEGYFKKGIPVLDIETTIYNWSDYCNKFCNRVHDKTGIWPMIYTSAGFLPNLDEFKYYNECGLWVAGYPYPAKSWTDETCPYNVNPWKFPAIWQFSSSLVLNGYNGRLDGNIAYMDIDGWNKYAGKDEKPQPKPKPKPQPKPKKETYQIAFEVIRGKWGNGTDRKKKLESYGYDYSEIQNYVNNLYTLAHKVIRGEYGNGETRKKKLGKDYDAVQHIVNDILN